VLGASFEESCLEEELGLGEVATIEAEAFLRAFEAALVARGVPFAYAAGESLDASVAGARWVVCATAGGIKPAFLDQLRRRAQLGVKVTIGPRVPARDGSMRLLERPLDVSDFEVEPLEAIDRAGALVARRIEELGITTYAIDRDDAYVTVHEDGSGAPRVVFVMNPTSETVLARVSVAGASRLVDAIATAPTASSFDVTSPRGARPLNREAGGFRVQVPARSVRMLEVVPLQP
jgi:beta-galactosidase